MSIYSAARTFSFENFPWPASFMTSYILIGRLSSIFDAKKQLTNPYKWSSLFPKEFPNACYAVKNLSNKETAIKNVRSEDLFKTLKTYIIQSIICARCRGLRLWPFKESVKWKLGLFSWISYFYWEDFFALAGMRKSP